MSTQWEKVRAFFADLSEKARREGGFLAILEVCGMNPRLLEMLQEYACREVVVIQPTERSKQKTDRRDAGELPDHQLEVVEAKLAERAAANEQAKLLESVPGLRHYSAVAIASRIGDIERFKRPDSSANFFGLTPGCRNSGETRQRLGSITKRGSRMVRYLLNQAVVKILRFDGAMRSWFKRIKKRRGAIASI